LNLIGIIPLQILSHIHYNSSVTRNIILGSQYEQVKPIFDSIKLIDVSTLPFQSDPTDIFIKEAQEICKSFHLHGYHYILFYRTEPSVQIFLISTKSQLSSSAQTKTTSTEMVCIPYVNPETEAFLSSRARLNETFNIDNLFNSEEQVFMDFLH
jgi:hypothetical protein